MILWEVYRVTGSPKVAQTANTKQKLFSGMFHSFFAISWSRGLINTIVQVRSKQFPCLPFLVCLWAFEVALLRFCELRRCKNIIQRKDSFDTVHLSLCRENRQTGLLVVLLIRSPGPLRSPPMPAAFQRKFLWNLTIYSIFPWGPWEIVSCFFITSPSLCVLLSLYLIFSPVWKNP